MRLVGAVWKPAKAAVLFVPFAALLAAEPPTLYDESDNEQRSEHDCHDQDFGCEGNVSYLLNIFCTSA